MTGLISFDSSALNPLLKKKEVLFFSAVLAAGLLCAAACKNRETAPAPAPSSIAARASRVIGLGRVEPETRFLDLTAEVQGAIIGIHFKPGDFIAKGQAVVELTRAVEEARVEQAAAVVKAQLSEIESKKAALASARIRAENAKLAFSRAKTLYEQDAQAKVIYDNANADYESLLKEVTGFEADVASAENVLDQNKADLRLARAQLDQRFVRAPSDGQLLSLDVSVGAFLAPARAFGTFAPQSPLTARCEIDELFADLVRVGQKAFLRQQGMTEVIGRGEVSFAGPFLRRKSLFADDVGDLEDRRVREVWVRLDPGTRLLYGSRIECVIDIGE